MIAPHVFVPRICEGRCAGSIWITGRSLPNLNIFCGALQPEVWGVGQDHEVFPVDFCVCSSASCGGYIFSHLYEELDRTKRERPGSKRKLER